MKKFKLFLIIISMAGFVTIVGLNGLLFLQKEQIKNTGYIAPVFQSIQQQFSDEDVLAAAYSDYRYKFLDTSEIGHSYLKHPGTDNDYLCFDSEKEALQWLSENVETVMLSAVGYYYASDKEKIEIREAKKITEKSFIDFSVFENNYLIGVLSAFNCNYIDTKDYNFQNKKIGILKFPITVENIKSFTEYYWQITKRDEKILTSVGHESSVFIIQDIFSIKIPWQPWSPSSPRQNIYLMNYKVNANKENGEILIFSEIVKRIEGRELIHAELQ